MSWKYSVPYTRELPSGQSKYGTLPNPPKFSSERPSRWSTANNSTVDSGRTFRTTTTTDSNPTRAKHSASDNQSSVVQRLKERYSISGAEDNLSPVTRRTYGRSLTTLGVSSAAVAVPKPTSYEAENRRDYKNSPSAKVHDNAAHNHLKLRKPSDIALSSVPDTISPKYSPKSPGSAYSSRFFPAKNFSSFNLTSQASAVDKPAAEPSRKKDEEEAADVEVVTVVTRGTSPSQTTSSIYLRTRRADFGLEKKIHRSKIKPPFSHKETQTDKSEESHLSRYGYSDGSSRIKPWTSYSDKYSTPSAGLNSVNRYSTKSSFKSDGSKDHLPLSNASSVGSCRRSISRESSSLEPKSPDSLPKSPGSSGESPVSPKNIAEFHLTSKPPTSVRSAETIKLSTQKTVSSNKESDKVMPPRKLSSSLKIETASAPEDQAKSPTRNGIGDRRTAASSKPHSAEGTKPSCKTKDIHGIANGRTVEDVSSTSESSSEGDTTSSDEEVDRIRASETSLVKRSITNFLQNIPNAPNRKVPESVMRSKSGAFHKLSGQLGPPPKITFNRVESGERAWWMDNTEAVPEGIVKIVSNGCLTKHEDTNDSQGSINVRSNLSSFKSDSNTNANVNNQLTARYLINRQFTVDMDWLKDDENDQNNETTLVGIVDGNNNIAPYNGEIAPSLCDRDPLSGTDSSKCGASIVGGETPPRGSIPKSSDIMDDDTGYHGLPVIRSMSNAVSGIPFVVCNGRLPDATGETLDVTPGLRRRREQSRGKSPEISPAGNVQVKFGQGPEIGSEAEGKDTRDRSPSLINQNGLGSPVEEKTAEVGDMSGLISKAKADLAKSKTKLDVRKSSSREMSPKVSEIEIYWKELVDSLNRPLRLCDLDFTDLNSEDEVDILGSHREEGEIPPPPPMLILPPTNSLKVPVPPLSSAPFPGNRGPKTPVPPPPSVQPIKNKKTVKLFWKEIKVEPIPLEKPKTLIWDEMAKVNVDTQKLELLFESRAKDLITKKQQEQNKSKEIIVLDHKRSNAINIGMTKLPPPRAIKTAILKMDSTVVNKEGIEKLLTMLPTEEEKLRIQDAQSSNPDVPLGSAEQFLLILASISELEARLKLWAFKLDFENCEREICEPLMDLKQGIEILRANKTFRAILSTLLSVGNFLNGCDVKGFQIDYLSKVPEVKDTVQKHSLLHHLCAIVMEKFPESTDLYSEIGAVTRASKVDFDELAGNIRKIEEECKLSWHYLKVIAKHEGHTAMKVKMSDFLADCAERIIVVGIVHKRIINRFRKFILWLGTPVNRLSITRPNEIFKIISEFALEYRTTRERIIQQLKKINHREKSRSRGYLAGYETADNYKKMNSKEARDDAKLRQLLGNEATYPENTHNSTWRRHRKDKRSLLEVTNNNDDEIIETLIKTANQLPSHRPSLKDRRRSNRIIERHY